MFGYEFSRDVFWQMFSFLVDHIIFVLCFETMIPVNYFSQVFHLEQELAFQDFQRSYFMLEVRVRAHMYCSTCVYHNWLWIMDTCAFSVMIFVWKMKTAEQSWTAFTKYEWCKCQPSTLFDIMTKHHSAVMVCTINEVYSRSPEEILLGIQKENSGHYEVIAFFLRFNSDSVLESVCR